MDFAKKLEIRANELNLELIRDENGIFLIHRNEIKVYKSCMLITIEAWLDGYEWSK